MAPGADSGHPLPLAFAPMEPEPLAEHTVARAGIVAGAANVGCAGCIACVGCVGLRGAVGKVGATG